MKVKLELDKNLKEPEIIIKANQLTKELSQLIQDLQARTTQLIFYRNDTEYYLDLGQVLFFEVSERKTWAHTKGQLYQVKASLQQLEAQLPRNFQRCSKSVVVNTELIYTLTKNVLGCEIGFADTEKKVFVSRHYYRALRDYLQERMKQNGK